MRHILLVKWSFLHINTNLRHKMQLRFCIPSSHHIREFHYVNLKMNWTNAQNYCREKYTDLASIESTNHIKRLTTPYLDTEIAWIGLRDDPDAWKSNMGNSINSWRWSVTREPSTTGYQNWVFANPNNLFSAEYCVIMDIAGAWLDTRCGFLKFFVCYNGKKRFFRTCRETNSKTKRI
uniref:C-type lectin domain-containing protein n=1 Tax=Amphiprion percula TaxID=161767 RepID=A0A3P8UD27_AMPPE